MDAPSLSSLIPVTSGSVSSWSSSGAKSTAASRFCMVVTSWTVTVPSFEKPAAVICSFDRICTFARCFCTASTSMRESLPSPSISPVTNSSVTAPDWLLSISAAFALMGNALKSSTALNVNAAPLLVIFISEMVSFLFSFWYIPNCNKKITESQPFVTNRLQYCASRYRFLTIKPCFHAHYCKKSAIYVKSSTIFS